NKTGSDLWVNAAGVTLSGFVPGDSDLTDFILNASGLLTDGTSIGPTAFLTVTVPDPLANGQYMGLLTVQGGATPFDDASLGTANFQVNVSNVPEPSFLFLTPPALMAILLRHLSARRSLDKDS
ncbi:MAG TPA: hypothetical protein VKV15_08880, partial [Bryobacteraceae bacterium]|nr:hypothetical protein [Bryobacteraceae bacterium]